VYQPPTVLQLITQYPGLQLHISMLYNLNKTTSIAHANPSINAVPYCPRTAWTHKSDLNSCDTVWTSF